MNRATNYAMEDDEHPEEYKEAQTQTRRRLDDIKSNAASNAFDESTNDSVRSEEKAVNSVPYTRKPNNKSDNSSLQPSNLTFEHVYFNMMLEENRPKPVEAQLFEVYVQRKKCDMNAFMAEFMVLGHIIIQFYCKQSQ